MAALATTLVNARFVPAHEVFVVLGYEAALGKPRMFVSQSKHLQGTQTIQKNDCGWAVGQMHRLLSRHPEHTSGQGRWMDTQMGRRLQWAVLQSTADVSICRTSATWPCRDYLAHPPWSSSRPHPVTTPREIWCLLPCLRVQHPKRGRIRTNGLEQKR